MAKEFKAQKDLQVTDLYPMQGKRTRGYRSGNHPYDKQERALFKVHSQPMRCPCCNRDHTLNELNYMSADYVPGIGGTITCPQTGELLDYKQGLVAGQVWLERKSDKPIA